MKEFRGHVVLHQKAGAGIREAKHEKQDQHVGAVMGCK
jgi:hypothetical protein